MEEMKQFVKQAMVNRNTMKEELLLSVIEKTGTPIEKISLVEKRESDGFRWYYDVYPDGQSEIDQAKISTLKAEIAELRSRIDSTPALPWRRFGEVKPEPNSEVVIISEDSVYRGIWSGTFDGRTVSENGTGCGCCAGGLSGDEIKFWIYSDDLLATVPRG